VEEYRRYYLESPWKDDPMFVEPARTYRGFCDRLRSKLEKVAIYRYIHDDTGLIYRGASSVAWMMGSYAVRDIECRRMMESRNVDFRQLCLLKTKAFFGSLDDTEILQRLINEEIIRKSKIS
jgi:hypothetical protein